ncbi:GNAT family N-acyltransferase [Hahella ganghwensis]|uniref:GNAT family N-acyltransferase n=1 Tax=Hahella ganghwensis TaxID=286420 RepID=UPI00037A740D|nr:GNAT family N-acyltransferase [Hahella ganghwensis]
MLAEKQSLYSTPPLEPLLTAHGRPVSVLKAESLQHKEEVFKIRYEVYCKHLAYESSQKNARGLETDIYDGWSKHFLVKDELSGRYVGTLRLVMPQSRTSQAIPIEHLYPHDYFSPELAPSKLEAGSYIEISRLAVLPEAAEISCSYSVEVSRLLYLGALAYVQENPRLRHVYCLMEKRLARRLSFLGLPFTQAGDFFEFRGQRAPFYAGKGTVNESLKGDSKIIYRRLLEKEREQNALTSKVA